MVRKDIATFNFSFGPVKSAPHHYTIFVSRKKLLLFSIKGGVILNGLVRAKRRLCRRVSIDHAYRFPGIKQHQGLGVSVGMVVVCTAGWCSHLHPY